jgi:hypothetical protein
MTAHPGREEARPVTSQAPSRRRYEIVVGGRLSERYGAALEGVTLEPRSGQTMLRGDFADQSHLYGMLDRLRDFGIELISVNAVD